MDHIVATKDVDGRGGLISVIISEILYLKCRPQKMHIKVVTANSEYNIMGTMKYWIDTLNDSGYLFKLIDRSTTVNVDKIAGINQDEKTIMFAERNTGTECTIAFHRYKETRDRLVKLNNNICII